jgi:hypothetical protein
MGQHLRGVGAAPGQRVGGKAQLREAVERAGSGCRPAVGQLAPGIGEEPQRPGARDRRVELAQRAGGGVARIGEGLAARPPPAARSAPRNRRGSCRPRRAPPGCRARPRSFRDVVDGAALAVTFSPVDAVAAGRRRDQATVLVAQRQRQPVDLGLGGEGQRRVIVEAEVFADAGDEIASRPLRRRRSTATSSACAWVTFEKPSAGAAPTLSLGLSVRFRPGKRASIAAFSRFSAS